MNINKSVLRIAALSAVAFSVISCDQDFESLGGEIIGGPGFDADLYDEAQISATSVNLTPVQTNNLSVNLLGFYDHEVYGAQTANILTQLSLPVIIPDFGNLPQMDSVVLKIPYFSTEKEADSQGKRQYELDSVVGSAPIKLSIQESRYFLNQYDPESNFEKGQKYYSNMHEQILGNITGDVIFEQESFRPSDRELVEFGLNEEGEKDTLYSAPAMRIKLDNAFFQRKILNRAGSSEITNSNEFRNYFRGIYIQTEAINNRGSMMLLNLAHEDAGITLHYSVLEADTEDVDDDGNITEMVKVPKTFKLSFGPGRVNTFQQEETDFNQENIYLKGGEGAMTIIELFNGPDSDSDGISDELEMIRENNWLINEANLTFYVNRNLMGESLEPEQLYLYDLNNNRILTDYSLETNGQANGLESRINDFHLGRLERDDDDKGISYKIRLTTHVNNLLNKDSTNIRLGLVVAQNVNIINNSALLTSPVEGLDRVPSTSVMTPLGTVLYGPNAPEEDKRLKLNIYYTEAKE